MIIACPACATRYVVPDSAIGVDGRTVRCAKCRHSWFQDGPNVAAAPPPAEDPAPPAVNEQPVERVADPTPAPAATTPETSGGADEASPPPAADWDDPHPAQSSQAPAVEAAPEVLPDTPPQAAPHESVTEPDVPAPPISFADEDLPPPPDVSPISAGESLADDEYSRFAHEPLFRPRRNPARMWTIAAALFAVVALGAVGATAWFGMPSWMPFAHPLFAEEQPGLTLDFPAKMQGQRPLSDQTWFFEANGTVTNVSQAARSVPTILAVLKDARGRIVFTAELHSPKRVLAPGESVSINEALVSVPKAAVRAEYGWKPGS
ncbi:MAG: MJ0042-type zinc finger domain-containing protein [Novosphingobium sp.]